MSTRSTTKFGQDAPTGQKPEAIVYRHSDGYPDAMIPALEDFFDTVEKETKDWRYNDATYLASKWLVWLAREFSTPFEKDSETGEYGYNLDSPKRGSLDFLSVGIVQEDPGDIEYSYWLDCSTGKRPNIYVRAEYGDRSVWFATKGKSVAEINSFFGEE